MHLLKENIVLKKPKICLNLSVLDLPVTFCHKKVTFLSVCICLKHKVGPLCPLIADVRAVVTVSIICILLAAEEVVSLSQH